MYVPSLCEVRFRRESTSGPVQCEVLRQLVASKDMFHQILGIYGFEEGDRETECMVCYDRPRSVVVLPCRHCFVCPACLRSLREEKCPMCRARAAQMHLKKYLHMNTSAKQDVLSIYLSIYLSVCLSVCLSIYLSIYIYIYIHTL